jgi:signal transduction histidine kinase
MRELLGLTALVLLVVAVATAAHLVSVARLTLGSAAQEGRLLSRQLLHQAAYVLQAGGTAAALRTDPSLRAVLDGILGYSRVVVFGAIVDASGRALVHSDPALEGRILPRRVPLDEVLAAGLPHVAGMLFGSPQIYEIRLPVRLGEQPFGAVRVGVSTSLVRQALQDALVRSVAFGTGALLLALAVGLGAGGILIRWAQRIARRVERLARRDAADELAPGDDMGRLAERMKGLGERIQEAAAGGGTAPDAVDRLQNAVVLVRADGTVAFANEAAERLLGPALPGRPLGQVLPPGSPLGDLASALLAPGAEPRHRTVTLEGARGLRDCAVSGYPLDDGGAVLVLGDLEPVRAVESLVSYSQKLAALGRLTSGVTHEVKNPLNAMRIHLELLRARLAQAGGGPPSGAIAENLDVIANEIHRLDRVVQGFLRFVRPQDLRLGPVDVNALLTGLVRVAAPEAAAGNVEIVLDLSAGLPPVTADVELIGQACTNLVTNAIQAMPAGGTLALASRRAARGAVEIRVADQGVGIPPEDLDKVFRLYFTTKPGGSGIGLALVYRIMQMHDGRIDIESTVAKGTTVTLTLPAAPEPA